MKILVVHPGASWSTADVEAGLTHGLQTHGVEVIKYRFDNRIVTSAKWLHTLYRRRKKIHPDTPKPTPSDCMYHAGVGVIERALRHQVDAVVVVSAMYLHPDILVMLRRAGILTTVLFTESPYDQEQELKVAALVDGCWTMERSSVGAFLAVNPRSGYIPHGWHPEKHKLQGDIAAEVPAHDVVFVGTAFRERIEFLSSIDWTGIDFGLYGCWDALGPRHKLRQYLRHSTPIDNAYAAQLYRKAKISLNLYRKSIGFGLKAPYITHAESLNPRGYELAACGAFHLSDYRQEVPEVFGELVPTFKTPKEAEQLIRQWLSDAEGRQRVSAQLPRVVAQCSWDERATRILGDLQQVLLQRRVA